ncbi:MAG: hypothetical protein C9356_15710 [Oleiphilus sp.]|nr:MAG: hypothetical protein C9356_15710 [Oleiphilus sp.]
MAETITLTGSLTVVSPSISPVYEANPTAYESPDWVATLTNNTPGACTVTETLPVYNSGRIDCVVQWGALPDGISQVASGLSGVFEQQGNESISYTINGSSNGTDLDLTFGTGTVDVAVLPAPQPTIQAVFVQTGSGPVSIFSPHVFTDQNETYISVDASVEARGYDQSVSISFGNAQLTTAEPNCNVPAGSTLCSFGITHLPSDQFGEVGITLTAACDGPDCASKLPGYTTNGYFDFEWDYRPPLASHIELTGRPGATHLNVSPVVDNLRGGETFTLHVDSSPTNATITPSANQTQLDILIGDNAVAPISFFYRLESNYGRTALSTGVINVLPSRILDTNSVPFGFGGGGGIPFNTDAVANGNDGPLQGTIAGSLVLSSSSTGVIRIDGQPVSRSTPIPFNMNFGDDGRPQVTFSVADENGEAQAFVQFIPDDPLIPMVVLPIVGYEVTANVVTVNNVLAGLENASARIDTSCPVVSESAALEKDGNCFIRFSGPTHQSSTNTLTAKLSAGTTTFGYQVVMLWDGEQVVIDDSFTLSATPLTLSFELLGAPVERIKTSNPLTLVGESTVSDHICQMHTGEIIPTPDSAISGNRLYCNIVWTQIPTGYEIPVSQSGGTLMGTITDPNSVVVSAQIRMLPQDGSVISLGSISRTLSVIDPLPPEINIEPRLSLNPSVFITPVGSDSVYISGEVNGSAFFDLEVVSDATELTVWPNTSLSALPVDAANTVIGASRNTQLRASYTNLPDIASTIPMEIVGVPDLNTYPILDVLSSNNVDGLTAEVNVVGRTPACTACEYDIARDGVWRVALREYGAETDLVPEVEIDANGSASFNTSVSTGRSTYVAIARFYDDNGRLLIEKQSNTVRYETVATNISGTAQTNYSYGAIPFRTSLNVLLDDFSDYEYVSRVNWLSSTDGGTTWVPFSEGSRSNLNITHTFAIEGDYLVRAEIFDTSGGSRVTNNLSLSVFEAPNVSIDALPRVLAGDSHTSTALVNDSPIDLGEWTIEWLVNDVSVGNDTQEHVIANALEGVRYKVEAKVSKSGLPQGPTNAFSSIRYIESGVPRNVGFSISGPNRLVNGDSFVFHALETSNDYGLTLAGDWILPDGSRVGGTTLNYTPSGVSLGSNYIRFEGYYTEMPAYRTEQRMRVNFVESIVPIFRLGVENLPIAAASSPRTLSITATQRDSSNKVVNASVTGRLEVLPGAEGTITIAGNTMGAGATTPYTITYDNGIPDFSYTLQPGANGDAKLTLRFIPDDPVTNISSIDFNGYETVVSHGIKQNIVSVVEKISTVIDSSCPIVAEPDARLSCYIVWNNTAGLNANGPVLHGDLPPGGHMISFDLMYRDSQGDHLVASESVAVSAALPMFNFVLNGDDINRAYLRNELTLSGLETNEGHRCMFYTGEHIPTDQRRLDSKAVYCHVNWTQLPNGFTISNYRPERLTGVNEDRNDRTFIVEVTAMLETGDIVHLGAPMFIKDILEPAMPTWSVMPYVTENSYYLLDSGSNTIRVRGYVGGEADLDVFVRQGAFEGNMTSVRPYRSLPVLQSPTNYTLGTVREMEFVAQYKAAPDIRGISTQQVVVIPKQRILPEMTITGGESDLDPTVIDIKMVDLDCNVCPYDPAVIGQWYLDVIGTTRYETNILVSDVPLYSGQVSQNVPTSLETISYVGVLKFIDQEGRVVDTRTTQPMTVTAVKRSDFEGQISAISLSGPAPYRAYFMYTPDDPNEWKYIRSIEWEADDGFGWTSLGTQTRQGYFKPTFEVGQWSVRARINGIAHTTVIGDINVDVYSQPIFSIEGPANGLLNETMEQTLFLDGQPIDEMEWVVDWYYDNSDYLDRATVSLIESMPAQRTLYAAIYKRSEQFNPNKLVFKKQKALSMMDPVALDFDLQLPNLMVEGETYTLTASTDNPWGLTLNGYWVAPDGSTHNGTTISYTVSERTWDAREFQFHGHYDERPLVTGMRNAYIPHSSNEAPRLLLIASESMPVASPGTVSITVFPDGYHSHRYYQDAEITATVPDGVELLAINDNVIWLRFTEQVTGTIGVTATKNAKTESANFSFESAAPSILNAALTSLVEQDYIDASGKAVYSVATSGVVLPERIQYYDVLVNGQTPSYKRYYQDVLTVSGDDGAANNVELTFYTNYGREFSANASFTVN